MKKIFLTILFALSFILISCGDDATTPAVVDNSPVDVDNYVPTDVDNVVIVEEDEIKTDEDAAVTTKCKLDAAFIEPVADWTSYFTLKQIGVVGDYAKPDESEPATISESVIKMSKLNKAATFGMWLNYQNQVILAQTQAYTFLKQGTTDGVVEMWAGMVQYDLKELAKAKLQADEEGVPQIEIGTVGNTMIQDIFLDLVISGGQVTGQSVRKMCFLAITDLDLTAQTVEAAFPGKTMLCTDTYTSGAAGETLKMMFNDKLTEDSAKILEFVNMNQDGTVKDPSDPTYQKICTCYNEKGQSETEDNEIDCATYNPCGTGMKYDATAAKCVKDTVVDPCSPNPCKDTNKTVCAAVDGKAVCSCDEGFMAEGDNCVAKPIVDLTCSAKGAETVCAPATAATDCSACKPAAGGVASCPGAGPTMNKCTILGCDKAKSAETCPTGKTCIDIPAGTPGVPAGITTVCFG